MLACIILDMETTVYKHKFASKRKQVNKRKRLELFTVKEAAEHLGLEESHIRRLLGQGKIDGERMGRDWIVYNLNYERKRKPKGG
jgi:excisionase family DNA binding protein